MVSSSALSWPSPLVSSLAKAWAAGDVDDAPLAALVVEFPIALVTSSMLS